MAESPSLYIPAAEQWSAYENSCATLHAELRGGGGRMAVSLARAEVHYFLIIALWKTAIFSTISAESVIFLR